MKCQVAKVVGPTVYFSNLNASNWVYGTKVTNQDFFAAYTKLVE
jgi:hypothetical protein